MTFCKSYHVHNNTIDLWSLYSNKRGDKNTLVYSYGRRYERLVNHNCIWNFLSESNFEFGHIDS